ncbi:AAA family ATPase [Candidatus Saccharibacteria bacterium]|nr:AAA family ATPase [Candidatus Saccharibacteria bacterium]
MAKITPTKPILVGLYGFPGSGKSYLARNLSTAMRIANVSADRIRGELFARPRYDNRENAIVSHLMDYMTEEFLSSGVSVIYDTNATRRRQRHHLQKLAAKHRADYLLVWLQIDAETSFLRTQHRDRRTTDDRFAAPLSRQAYDNLLNSMQNPEDEDYIVVSGKHAFVTQKTAIVNRLYREGLINTGTVQSNILAKPGLVNLVPAPRPTDYTRRNISISQEWPSS